MTTFIVRLYKCVRFERDVQLEALDEAHARRYVEGNFPIIDDSGDWEGPSIASDIGIQSVRKA